MSCGTCPTSAQPTTRADGMAPTPGQLLWSKDVGAWYRRQRAQGRSPVVTGVVAAPVATQLAGPRLRFGYPRTAEDAARCIGHELASLTRHKFRVTAERIAPGRQAELVSIMGQSSDGFTEEEKNLLRERGMWPADNKPRISLTMLQEGWGRCAVRLQVQETAWRLLPRLFPCPTHDWRIMDGNEVLLCEPPNGLPTLIVREGRELHTLSAAGTLSETFPTEELSSSGLRERRKAASQVYCPLCGQALLDRSRDTCGDCASAEQMV